MKNSRKAPKSSHFVSLRLTIESEWSGAGGGLFRLFQRQSATDWIAMGCFPEGVPSGTRAPYDGHR